MKYLKKNTQIKKNVEKIKQKKRNLLFNQNTNQNPQSNQWHTFDNTIIS